jgi:hypothetical protein
MIMSTGSNEALSENRTTAMGYRILRALSRRPEAVNENHSDHGAAKAEQGPVMRDLATGASLAVAVDASPAVLVTLHGYAKSFRPTGRRSA